MANLKNIADLPLADSASGVNLIIEDNGVAKKIAADTAGLGGGGTSDAVQYIEQELTEGQQMQARKNMGLYTITNTFVDEFELTLGESSVSHGIAFDSGNSGKQIKIVLSQDDAVLYTLVGVLEYIGNPIYDYIFTVETNDGRNRLKYDLGDWSNDGINTISGTYQTTVYLIDIDKISEDYIPDTIARTSAIPSMNVADAVADAVGDTVTGAEFNALLNSLRNAGILSY